MNPQEVLEPQRWAEITFGSTQLKDMRRTRRAVMAATHMARDASASLPHQMQTWKDVKALYRLLDEADVTIEALMQPHWQQTQMDAQAQAIVLLVQDTTEIDLSHRTKISGIGQIGNAKGRGVLLQTALAVLPETRSVLGCLAQKPFVCIPAPHKEQRYQRRHREYRETDVWMEVVRQISFPSSTSMMVHVGDRVADMFPFFCACLSTQTHFVVLTSQTWPDDPGHLCCSISCKKKRRKRRSNPLPEPVLCSLCPFFLQRKLHIDVHTHLARFAHLRL